MGRPPKITEVLRKELWRRYGKRHDLQPLCLTEGHPWESRIGSKKTTAQRSILQAVSSHSKLVAGVRFELTTFGL
jgi:hypothetical protein